VVPHRTNRALKITTIARGHQRQATGAIPLVFEASVSHFAEAVENTPPWPGRVPCRRQFRARAFVQSNLHPSAQLDVWQPVAGEQLRSIRPTSRSATAKPFWRG